MSKEVTVFVVDVSGGMAESHMSVAEGKSDLEMVKTYLYDKIGAKLIFERKTDVIGIIAAGTESTRNALAATPGYENITELYSIRQFLMNDFASLKDTIVPHRGYSADLFSATICAVDLIKNYVRHLKFIKNIIILSNCGADMNFDDDDGVIDLMAKLNITLRVFTVGANEQASSEVQRYNHDRLNEFVNRAAQSGIDAVFSPFDAVLEDLRIPNVKKVRSVNTFHGQLTLGDREHSDCITIDVQRVACVMESTPPASVRFVKEGTGPVVLGRRIVYEVTKKGEKGEVAEEISPEGLQKGYMYGRTVVPIESEDILTFSSTPSYEILGFIENKKLMTNTYFVIAKKDDHMAATGLWSIIKALDKAKHCAVARFVPRQDKGPVMVLLTPFISDDHEALVECQLPFAEDVRMYKFPSLEIVKTIRGKVLTEHHYLPTQEMKDNMTAYINAMDISSLSPEGLPVEPDAPNAEEYARVGTIFNPVSAMIKQAILHRALNPDGGLPQLSAEVLRQTVAPPKLVEQASAIADRLVASVNVKRVPKYRTNKRRYEDAAKEELEGDRKPTLQELVGVTPSPNTSPAKKRIKSEIKDEPKVKEEPRAAEDEDDEFDLEHEVNRWKTLQAGPDTDEALPKLFERACVQIDALIEEAAPSVGQITTKMSKLRKMAVVLDEPGWYNDYLIRLEDSLVMGAKGNVTARVGVWKRLMDDGLGEISVDEDMLEL